MLLGDVRWLNCSLLFWSQNYLHETFGTPVQRNQINYSDSHKHTKWNKPYNNTLVP